MKAEDAIQHVIEEFECATRTHGKFHSRHEGFAVLKEEVDELWDAVKANDADGPTRFEAVQVGAMALRFLVDCV